VHNYDDILLNEVEILELGSRRVTDLVVVVVKPPAEENVATRLRIKLEEKKNREVKGKGPDMLTKCETDTWTTTFTKLELNSPMKWPFRTNATISKGAIE
jgi:hypothetical protein